MSLIIGMFDEILNIDAMLKPLVERGHVKADHVTYLVRKEGLAYAQTRTELFEDHLSVPDEDFAQVLMDKGIPKVEALFYAHGIRAGKEIVMVQSDSANSQEISRHLQQGERPALHPTTAEEEPRVEDHNFTTRQAQMNNRWLDEREDTERETVDMVEEEAMKEHRENRWKDDSLS